MQQVRSSIRAASITCNVAGGLFAGLDWVGCGQDHRRTPLYCNNWSELVVNIRKNYHLHNSTRKLIYIKMNHER